ncbi:Natural resistance-associated macrophage protein [Rubrobacter radiotolerans]|uniref:Natural resistance-associated macrophage protein n=1 Tax=Rubrobacter radiotolerans TaxID=42256 RepID=A0A023X5L8_RUBRA|nr:Nramp family divalent metal transporter [Rubrobacter radiotolerans]AHY47767.1 Natural resistance-associated macrophage protein [Rubrobacter radiotolerans]MDX5892406.1 Nramp family divalent metal transporter [Rubrobacter radiotolerans]SMC07697.1 Mn2+ and Fe2+ transporters of the NRAMP family [Rubrobacter radiotolerans DSM 5868]
MSDAVRDAEREAAPSRQAPQGLARSLRYVGPGLVVAATGVGAGDMVSSLSAGTSFGTVLIWAVVIGAVLKYVLTEGLGRWYMSTGRTILEGWRSLGRWATAYFGIYLLIVTFVFGAAAVSSSALAVTALFPGVLPLWAWAVLHGVAGFLIVGYGRYKLFERVMEVFIGIMFVTVVGLAVLLGPNVGELALGTVVPRIPDGSLLYALAVLGGVGGTYTLASYPYWARERGWSRPEWIPVMRVDIAVGYAITAIFMVAMLVIGAELLFASGESIDGESGLVALSEPISARFGGVAAVMFLIGFWAAATSSILGAWNGGAYLFADLVRTARNVPDERAEEYLSEKSVWFRGFLAWMTFPPMVLLALGQPILLVIVYASLGALFMPFLALTLLWLLNSSRTPTEHRSGWLSNLALGGALVLFTVLGINELIGTF